MSIFDTILVVILSGFVFYGLFFGLIRTLGTFVGVVVGAFLASRFYLPVAAWIEPFFFGYVNFGRVAVFIILFSLVNRLTGLAFYLLDRTFNLLSIIPFLKTFNRLGGLVLGFATGALTIGLILFVSSRYSFLESMFGRYLAESELAPFFISFAGLLMPLLPEMLKKLQSLV